MARLIDLLAFIFYSVPADAGDPSFTVPSNGGKIIDIGPFEYQNK